MTRTQTTAARRTAAGSQLVLWSTRIRDEWIRLPDLSEVDALDDAAKARARLYRAAELIDCCTGLPCPTGWAGRSEYPQTRCGWCGQLAAPVVIGSDHDHPGTPCPGTVTLPAGTLRWEILQAWDAVPTEHQHRMRHDRRHWPDCVRCGCPRGLHRPVFPELPWYQAETALCSGRCVPGGCCGWAAPGEWPTGLAPDLRHAWLTQALAVAGAA